MTPRPQIAPVVGDRPRWSVMIPTYNCAHYLAQTLESVLAQDPGREDMHVEVVDDASSDRPEDIVAAHGERVAFFRQPHNVGHAANLNTCLQRSRGELVHVLHGDDAVRPGFYATLGRAFEDAAVGAAFCRFIAMDDEGRWTTIGPLEAEHDGPIEGWLEKIALGQRVQSPAMVVRRSVYEQIGGFDDRAGDAEDWEMWTRVAAHTQVWHVVEPLALYRIRGDSLSRGSLRTGQHVEHLRTVVELNRDVLPAGDRDRITREAREVIALTALKRARRYLGKDDAAAGRAQVRQALRTSRSPAVLERALEVGAIAGRRSLLRVLRRSHG